MIRRILVVLVVAAGAAAAWWYKPWIPREDPPALALDQVHEWAAESIRDAEVEVKARPSSDSWGQLAMLLMVHGFATEAQTCFRQALRWDTASFRWTYLLGVSLSETDTSAGILEFEKAVELASTEEERFLSVIQLAERLVLIGESDRAKRALAQIPQKKSGDPRVLLSQARLAALANDWHTASAAAQQSAGLSRDRRSSQELYVRALHALKDPRAASEQARLDVMPVRERPWPDALLSEMGKLRKTPDYFIEVAQQHLANREYGEAIAILSRIAREAPEVVETHVELWRAQTLIRKYKPAAETLKVALKHHPDSAQLHHLQGMEYFFSRRWKMAIEWYDSALERNPSNAETHLYRARCLVELEENQEAIAAFEEAIRYDPRSAAPHSELAAVHEANGQLEEAREQAETAVRLEPRNRDFARQLRKIKRAIDEQ